MIRSFLHGVNLKSRSQRKSSRRGHDRSVGGLECLEGRVLLSGNPTIYTVDATTDTGTGTGDIGDLRYVINQANADPNADGTVIQFDPTVFATPQTITLSPTGPLTLTDLAGPEVIDGPGAGFATVSGNNAVGVFSVASGVTATISGLTIDSGSTAANGGGIDNSGFLTLSNDILSNNTAAGAGGGIENEASGVLTDDGSTYTSDNAGSNGGAIDNDGVSATLTGDTFESNSAGLSGGGIANEFSVAGPNTLVVTQSTFTNNSAGGNGGGIDNGLTNTLTLASDTFDANTAAVSGGGVESEQMGTVSIVQGTFTNNTATSTGGGIDNQGGTLDVANSVINGNAAGDGGGISNAESGGVTITETTISDNSATDSGGGIENQGVGSTVMITSVVIQNNTAVTGGGVVSDAGTTITNSTITTNSATIGGGLANQVGGTLTVLGTAIVENSATNGAGVHNGATATLTSSTVAGNTAGTDGGGIFNQGPANLMLVACTVSGNSAPDGGGLYNDDLEPASASLTDTIIAGNIEPGGTPDDINGGDSAEVTGSYSLIGIGGSGGIIDGQNNNIVLTSLSTLNLAPLGDYGGPTATIALLSGSPAAGAGTAVVGVTTDQRGFPLASSPDIGAFQIQAAGLIVNTTIDGTGSPAGDLSLRQAVNLANQFGSDATILFDPTVFNAAQTITLTEGPLVLSNTQTTETIDGSTASGITINGNNMAGVFVIDLGTTASLTDLTITGGSAVSGGGIDDSGSLALSNSTVVNNTGTTGGGVFSDGTLTIVNSTIDDNTATNTGGGALFDGATVTVVNSTFADNVVPGGSSSGAGIYLSGGTVLLNNTIVALNIDLFPNGSTPDDVAGTPLSTSSGFNLIGKGGAGGLVNGTNGNLVGIANPQLGVLANNGGTTQTIALLAGSPAINAGSIALAIDPSTQLALFFDQRGPGYPRVVNGMVDIGAFEFSGTVTPPSTYVVTNTAASGAGSLASVIGLADADPNSGGSIISFDPTVFATMQTITVAATLSLSPPGGPIVINGPAAGVTISGGGAVGVFQVARGVTAAILGVTVSDGLTASSGGAIVNNLAATLTLTNDAFTDDGAAYFGGAIYNNGGSLTISNSTFTSDIVTAGLGGAIDNTGVLTVIGSTFTSNDAFQGGAIDNRSGSLAVRTSTFTSNVAIMGGAIFNDAIATVGSSTIANNIASSTASATPLPTYASFDGGAIANDLAGILTLTNSTLAYNEAGQAGGAIDSVGILNAVNDTIAYNVVASGGSGGGIYGAGGTTTLANTIVILNTAGTGTSAASSDISGNVAQTSAFNLIGTGGAGGLSDATNGNQVGVGDPGLATTLANNGGPTLTLALLAGSPAIDKGSNALAVDSTGAPLLYDQRGVGFPRIVNLIVDIGAFERALATTTTITSSLNPSVVGNPVVFTVTVSPSTANLTKPTGTVQLFNGTIVLATVTLVNGTATFVTSTLPLGINQISAIYSGDSFFATSTSSTLKQTVNEPTAASTAVATAARITAIPAAITVAAPSLAFTSIVTVSHEGPVAAVKKVVAAPTKAHPKGGSSTRFHQTKHTAGLKRSAAEIARHAKVKVKKK